MSFSYLKKFQIIYISTFQGNTNYVFSFPSQLFIFLIQNKYLRKKIRLFKSYFKKLDIYLCS